MSAAKENFLTVYSWYRHYQAAPSNHDTYLIFLATPYS